MYSLGANNRLGNQYGLIMGEICELTRIALNGKQGITSQALSISLKLLPKYIPLVRLVVPFADQNQNHYGIIYQATNWYYTGIGKSTPEYYINGRWMHQRQVGSLNIPLIGLKDKVKTRQGLNKFKYLYPIDKTLTQLCKKISKPYPKHAAEA